MTVPDRSPMLPTRPDDNHPTGLEPALSGAIRAVTTVRVTPEIGRAVRLLHSVRGVYVRGHYESEPWQVEVEHSAAIAVIRALKKLAEEWSGSSVFGRRAGGAGGPAGR